MAMLWAADTCELNTDMTSTWKLLYWTGLFGRSGPKSCWIHSQPVRRCVCSAWQKSSDAVEWMVKRLWRCSHSLQIFTCIIQSNISFHSELCFSTPGNFMSNTATVIAQCFFCFFYLFSANLALSSNRALADKGQVSLTRQSSLVLGEPCFGHTKCFIVLNIQL